MIVYGKNALGLLDVLCLSLRFGLDVVDVVLDPKKMIAIDVCD